MVCPPHERLLAHIEGLASEAERTELEKHLCECQSCREEVAILMELTDALRSAARSVGPVVICVRSDDVLAYADGRLDRSSAAEFEEHLVHCRSCLAELADVWAKRGLHECDADPETVMRVMRQLTEERRTLLVRITEKALTVARTVVTSIEEVAGWSVVPDLPAAAVARSRRRVVRVLWREEGDIAIEYLLEWSSGFPELTGRVESRGAPVPEVSVGLSNDAGTRGPESPDAAGRFGPWRLAPGQNTISLSGSLITGGVSHHGIAVDAVSD